MSTPPLPGRAVAGVPCTLRTRTVRVHGAMEDVPLLDRIDLHVEVDPVRAVDLSDEEAALINGAGIGLRSAWLCRSDLRRKELG